ncbi:MAG: hypothetical protein AABO57_11915 [Acidobacteriota bacterium]
MIARVRSALAASAAWVLDVKQFSNVSVCFSFEIPGNRVARLREALAAADLRLTRESNDSFASFSASNESAGEGSQTTDVAGTLQITFIHNEPDLKIEVPRIPG